MTGKEIALRLIDAVESFEQGKLRGLNAALLIEQIAETLAPEYQQSAEELKVLALRLAFWDHAPTRERPRAAASEIREIAKRLSA
jgi:hypothetical protein